MTKKLLGSCKIHVHNAEWGKTFSKKLTFAGKIWPSSQAAIADLQKADSTLKAWVRKEGGYNVYYGNIKVCSILPHTA